MKKILVFGKNGQLASSIKHLNNKHTYLFLGRNECDLLDHNDILEHIIAFMPDFIINTAAYTAVDQAETDKSKAFELNRDAPRNIAVIAAAYKIPFIHISTDFVFDGKKTQPYTSYDNTNPLNVYGQSKYEGEQAVLKIHDNAIIIRTSWLFSPFGSNFVKTMLRLGKEKETLSIVNDQIGCPTSAIDFVDSLMHIIEQKSDFVTLDNKIFHYCGQNAVSWYEFAEHIFNYAEKIGLKTPKTLHPIQSKDYKTAATRPAYSVMDCSSFTSTFGINIKNWESSLQQMITMK